MMNVTPQPQRSPVSPYQRQGEQPFSLPRPQYNASPNPESLSRQSASNCGLGLYPCSMPPSQTSIAELTTSPHTTTHWSQRSLIEHGYSQPEQPPRYLSASLDPFSGFANHYTPPNAHSPEAPDLEFECQTPPSSNLASHRGSVSSYTPSEAYSHSESEHAYTPTTVKLEENGEWYHQAAGSDTILQRSSSMQGPLAYPPGVSTLNSQTEDLYRSSQPGEWSKGDTTGYITALQASPEDRLPRFEVQPILPSVSRIKKKRQRTTPEEATHECRVCGKLFKRSYNWKSHMETHNPERKYPHPCTATIGGTPCTKKFQRKTDLDRHHDSVHLKARNYQCNLCGNRFARRDTLRRHTEDGCPKRFELGIRESSVATPSRWSLANFPPRQRSYSVGVPQTSPMAPPTSATSNATFPLFQRPEYPGSSQSMGALSSPAYPS